MSEEIKVDEIKWCISFVDSENTSNDIFGIHIHGAQKELDALINRIQDAENMLQEADEIMSNYCPNVKWRDKYYDLYEKQVQTK